MAQRSGDREPYLWEEGDFKISWMRPYHLPQVMAIEQSSFPQPWSYSLFLSELSNQAATYFVAFFQGKIIGYLGLWMVWGETHITTFAIHPAYRGEGFGKKLFGYALNYAKSQGCSEVSLEVRPSNIKAQNLYHSFGFKKIGVRKRYYADGEDAWVMKKVF